ncbi:MAG: hypothetical protein AAGD38_16930, partial [Acidobacteriota bacterium]
RQGLSLVSGGLLIGLGLAFLSSQRVADLLFEIPPSDPPTFTGVAIVLLLVATLASLLPAQRAASVSPTVALRAD